MDIEKLERDLEELREEIRNIEGIEPSAIQHLEQIVEDLRTAAGTDSSKGNQAAVRSEDLQRSIENFEIEHPAVTGILGRITNLLSDMGI